MDIDSMEFVLMELAYGLQSHGNTGIPEKYPSLFGEYSRISGKEVASAKAAFFSDGSPFAGRLNKIYSICADGVGPASF